MSLDELYREVILDHYRQPRNQGDLPGHDCAVDLDNPLCGDEIRLRLRLEGERVVAARFAGRGCSISQASASMMTELVKGRTVEEARALAGAVTRMMHGEPPGEDLGDAVALQGVAKFPVRIKCALLSWEALQKCLAQGEGADAGR